MQSSCNNNNQRWLQSIVSGKERWRRRRVSDWWTRRRLFSVSVNNKVFFLFQVSTNCLKKTPKNKKLYECFKWANQFSSIFKKMKLETNPDQLCLLSSVNMVKRFALIKKSSRSKSISLVIERDFKTKRVLKESWSLLNHQSRLIPWERIRI